METWQINIVLAVIILVTFTYTYKFMPARLLKNKKPFFAPLPKYKTDVTLTNRIINTTNPLATLSETLSKLGFTLSKQDETWATYSGGYRLSDFGEHILGGSPVNIKVAQPILNPTSIIIEYAWFVVFDTGNLWTFTTKLKSKLSR